MGNLDALFTLAELAITMTGISGLVAIFLSRGGLQAADKLRFYLILAIGMNAALLSFAPHWVSEFLSDPVLIWRYCSIVALTSMFATVIIPAKLKYVKDAFAELGDRLVGHIRVITYLIPTTVLMIFAFNALSWPVDSNSTFYEIGLFVMLTAMSYQFGALVLIRPDVTDTDAEGTEHPLDD